MFASYFNDWGSGIYYVKEKAEIVGNWKPADYIILIITLTIAFMMIFIVFLPLQEVVTMMKPETVKLIFVVITSLIAIVSMYIGARLQNGREKKDNEK